VYVPMESWFDETFTFLGKSGIRPLLTAGEANS